MDLQISAHALAGSSLQMALIQRLVISGVITADEVQEMLEVALLQLETAQAGSANKEPFLAARVLLETGLKKPSAVAKD